MTLHDAELVAFVAATDLQRARAFYEGTLGLDVVHEDDFAVVCKSAGTSVRITPVPEHHPAPFTVLGWRVDDIDETIDALAPHVTTLRFDGMAQDGRGVWTAPGGARIAWFHDPDGNVLSLTQLA